MNLSLYFTYESRGTLKSLTLFVKAITKLNLGHIDKSEITTLKISRRGSRPQNLVISRCCFAEDSKEMYLTIIE